VDTTAIFKWLLAALLVAGVSWLIGGRYAAGFTVVGAAMEPELTEGQTVYVNRAAARSRTLQRGDLVVVRIPNEEGQVIRRVIGLPGEQIELRAGELFVNGVKVEEPWLSVGDTGGPVVERASLYAGPITVAEGELLLLADNRRNARDSRIWGTVPRDHVLGVVWRVFGRAL
jgi:signal peptidase I